MADVIPKLPLFANVKMSYQLAWQHRDEYIKIVKWWLVFLVPVIFIQCAVQQKITHQAILDITQGEGVSPHLISKYLISNLPFTFAELMVCASIAVGWHQFILRSQQISVERYFRLDNVVINYFLLGLAIQLIGITPTVLSYLTNSLEAMPAKLIVGLLFLIIEIYLLLVGIRMLVLLPSVALQSRVTVREVLQRTRWNFWRIFWGVIFCSFPIYIVLFIIQFILSLILGVLMHGPFARIMISTVNITFFLLIALPVGLTFLSLSYWHFFERDSGESSTL